MVLEILRCLIFLFLHPCPDCWTIPFNVVRQFHDSIQLHPWFNYRTRTHAHAHAHAHNTHKLKGTFCGLAKCHGAALTSARVCVSVCASAALSNVCSTVCVCVCVCVCVFAQWPCLCLDTYFMDVYMYAGIVGLSNYFTVCIYIQFIYILRWLQMENYKA